jgi:hypothetical protein
MTIKEFKDWLLGIPEELLDYTLVIRDVKEMEEGKIGQKDIPVISAFVDKNNARLALIDPDSNNVIQKIRENAAKENAVKEITIEGSDLTNNTTTESGE